jgi:hypothetical protein
MARVYNEEGTIKAILAWGVFNGNALLNSRGMLLVG